MIRIRSAWTESPGGPGVTTQYFGGSTSGEAVAAANAVRNFWFQLENILSDQYTVNVEDDVEQIDPVTGQIQQVFNAPTAPVAFTSTQHPLPNATQGLIRLRTGQYVAGRELRGRLFLPGATEDRNTAGNVDAAFITLINGNWTFAYGGLPSTNRPVVWSPTHGQLAGVTSATMWDEWAVLRSRRD